jgi:Flp pilus assembly CpaF family ATPase
MAVTLEKKGTTDWSVANRTLFVESVMTRFYSHQQQNVKDLTLTQIEQLVQKQIEQINDSSIYTLKSAAEKRDPEAVQALRKMISDVISSLGVTCSQCADHDEMVLYVYSMLYGFKNVEMERLYDQAKEKGIEEIYANRHDDVRYKTKGVREQHTGIRWDSEKDVEQVLERLTRHHKAGAAGNINPVNRVMLADGTRLAFTTGEVSKPSFNLRIDQSIFLEKEDFVPRVMSESVYQVVMALTVAKTAFGIIGQGQVGKTALLRQMLYELIKVEPKLRIFVMEIMNELNLWVFFQSKGILADVVETVATQNQTLEDLYENMKQRAVDLIIQGEILSAREVSNLLTAFKSGHPMGPFTAHSTGLHLPRYLAEIMAQEKHVELEPTVSQITHVLDASVVMKEKIDGEPRKLVEIWQYPDYQKPELLVKYNVLTHQYEFYPAKEGLREKLETLSFSKETMKLYQHLHKVGILGGEAHV